MTRYVNNYARKTAGKTIAKFVTRAYRNRKRHIATGKRVWRAAKRLKKSVRAKALPSSPSPGRATYDGVESGSGEGVREQQLYADTLVVPLWSSTTVANATATGTVDVFSNAYNARDRPTIYVKGWYIDRLFEMKGFGTGEDFRTMTFHHALVQFKNLEDTNDFLQEYDTLKAKFFRDNRGASDRTSQFTNATDVGAAIWDMKYNALPINPSSNVKVLWHKRKTLNSKNLFRSNGGKYYWHIKKYVPFKKKITFRNRSDVLPVNPVCELYWCSTLTNAGSDIGPSAPEVANTFSANRIYYS